MKDNEMKSNDLRENVAVMTEVFKNAMTFEKYVKIWTDSLTYVNSLLAANSNSTKNALAGIRQEQHSIDTVDDEYAKYRANAKKDIRKNRMICLILSGILASLIIVGVILYTLRLEQAFYVFDTLMIPIFSDFGPIVFIAIIGYNLYKIHKRKKDMKQLTVQDSSHKKLVAENNIRAYNAYIEKAKTEKEHLISKKQEVLIQYNNAKTVLNDIYALDLIPKNYHGLVETATIYGYLYNRVCTCIGGHGGVYERYEDDKRCGVIISELKLINHKLDNVIKNQKELCEVVRSIDSTVSQIKSEIEHSNKIMSDIRTNSSITATATSQSAAAQSYIASVVWRNS